MRIGGNHSPAHDIATVVELGRKAGRDGSHPAAGVVGNSDRDTPADGIEDLQRPQRNLDGLPERNRDDTRRLVQYGPVRRAGRLELSVGECRYYPTDDRDGDHGGRKKYSPEDRRPASVLML
jgi:hypothetical protein